MKKVEAFIKSARLHDVIERLHEIDGLTGTSVFPVRGFGRSRNNIGPVHIADSTIESVPHVKIEIFCVDNLLDTVKTAIIESAHSGLRADGKVYVSHVDEAIRISNGESGDSAV
ncbi:MAG: P-II family nitrogen regulator [Fibrobacter sp.]|nr:P-II family nitrogen regulator [Fibrobacter sp.]